ncbi:hypothetical protein ACFL3V_03760 [Nanoarchaeota archaeon]
MKANAQAGLYSKGMKEAGKLDSEYGEKARTVFKAYEAAVSERGYSDKELMNPGKSKEVAKLMFSNKYLGNAKFNPLLKQGMYKDFDKKGDIEQQKLYQHMLGMNLDNFVSSGGVIDRYGGMQRLGVTQAVERQYDSQSTQQIMNWAWQKAYDPKKSLGENMDAYAKILQEDPILAGTGAKLDTGKFQSIEDIAQALTTSLKGRSSREGFQHTHDVEFN